MKTQQLHAIIDPLCGWCYAAAPLLETAKAILPINLHAGGLLIDERRRQVSTEFRDFILEHTQRITALTGLPFTSAFTDGILGDSTVILDSAPPIAALLAIKALGGDELQMLHDMQIAYYQQGKFLSDRDNLAAVAHQQNIAQTAFADAFAAALPHVDKHIFASRKLLAQVGSQSFPTLVLQLGDDKLIPLAHQDYYGKPEAWQNYLQAQIQ